MSQLVLVASAMSAMLKTPVKTYDECVANGYEILPAQILDINTVHSLLLFRLGTEERNTESREPSERPIQIFVITLSGERYNITQMRLEFAGKQLDDRRTLASYNIQQDRKYDYDFTNMKDEGATFIRGNLPYNRPYGWKRIALNVSVKHGSDDKWLGCVGNSSDEWPVSYHGTNKEYADSIADNGCLLCKGTRFLYGEGIYSTPKIEVAEDPYAVEFDNSGAKYKVVFQNRVNPAGLIKHDDIAYWVTPDEKNIRPYGLCIKKLQ
ncbi:4697_t:CDS:2 [Funneliformis geosporum]|uniref:6558_t:CDS:1 n=1 Tax=Funneliformis geosporum TaxID=1117311 RepID=A0A9W4SI62_9GLOM|nr:6558_t:CDS:2 [Funneliformis geosporum]CAI2171295.1 4697_t:CDS:2 [Funneliformis geosporum]